MLTYLFAIACVLTYAIVGAWTFGYTAGLDGRGEDCPDPKYKGLYYYRNEECAIVPAIFWPAALVYFLVIKPVAKTGYQRGTRARATRKVRIEIEKKLRVEQEKLEREAEEEVETALRKRTAA